MNAKFKYTEFLLGLGKLKIQIYSFSFPFCVRMCVSVYENALDAINLLVCSFSLIFIKLLELREISIRY